ncbi:hypothetical protein OPV22_030912 [Ensete ventricosum]|uniref:Uncharacterized protein n=1 Tax=Ensete ventricosum TaxID=4639 RepID=A0AAV8P0V0_ENSVE|nr:hypothetical protein OPV22_030912 [Ensete ventricosum]
MPFEVVRYQQLKLVYKGRSLIKIIPLIEFKVFILSRHINTNTVKCGFFLRKKKKNSEHWFINPREVKSVI